MQLIDAGKVATINFDDVQYFKRIALARAEASMKQLGKPDDIEQTDLQYPAEDGTLLRAKLHRPAGLPTTTTTTQKPPLIVMYHGGGFVTGSPESEEVTCRNFTRAFGAICLSVEYRLAPEFKYPCGVKDAWASLKWAAANAASWGADLKSGFVIGGTSAGGNYVGVLAHLARDEGLTLPLTGQYLAVPRLLPVEKVPEEHKSHYLSYEQNKDAPLLPQVAMHLFEDAYAPDLDDGVWYVPFLHPKGHTGLPPAYFQVDGMDPLRDEALLYERVLAEDYGIPTRLDVYAGVPHAHWLYFPELKKSEVCRKDQIHGMAWLLGKEPDFGRVTLNAGGSG